MYVTLKLRKKDKTKFFCIPETKKRQKSIPEIVSTGADFS